jgi:hypothetical protein
MPDINSILKKLNIMERTQLINYIKLEAAQRTSKIEQALGEAAKEREEFLTNQNDNTWQIINDNIKLALRENRISEERIKKVFSRVYELTSNNPNVRLFDVPEPSADFEILTKDEFRNLVEELIECSCKGCIKSSKDCDVYKLLKRHNVKAPSGYQRSCKYGY